MKSISSIPGATLFRSNSGVIIVLIVAAIFLTSIQGLEKDIEKVAIDKTVNDINAALAVALYQMTIRKELDQLNIMRMQSPFIFMATYGVLPGNFRGTIEQLDELKYPGSWYFNQQSLTVLYQFLDGDQYNEYQLLFDYEDVNDSGQFESRMDIIKQLSIQYLSNKKIART